MNKPPQDVLNLSQTELDAAFEQLHDKVSVADAKVSRLFRMFPNAKMVSINFGIALIGQGGMTITWENPSKR